MHQNIRSNFKNYKEIPLNINNYLAVIDHYIRYRVIIDFHDIPSYVDLAQKPMSIS